MNSASIALTVSGAALAIAALLHFACIFVGAPGYRLLGAGDQIVLAVQAGDFRPHLSAGFVGGALLLCSWYAIAGAGHFKSPPLQQFVLYTVSLLLLARAILFPLLKPHFPGNSGTFWLVSSTACGILGALLLYGAFNRPTIHGA
ncbi:MAG: hypothetical protein CFE44_13890 [Burkholderiales bacterium PBB4]|nr:MAG: hypothetical protein CFE44_13890 [Burkholderiales bacterium PBB4]